MTAPRARLPELPESGWNGDNRYDWLGNPFEYTARNMRDYGEACYRAAIDERLTHPAQAVDVDKVREVIDGMRCVARLSDYDLLVDTLNGAADKLTAALPNANANGKED